MTINKEILRIYCFRPIFSSLSLIHSRPLTHSPHHLLARSFTHWIPGSLTRCHRTHNLLSFHSIELQSVVQRCNHLKAIAPRFYRRLFYQFWCNRVHLLFCHTGKSLQILSVSFSFCFSCSFIHKYQPNA